MINWVLQLNNSQLENSLNSLVEKHHVLSFPNQPNPNPTQSVIDRGNLRTQNVFFVEKGKTSRSREIDEKGLQEELGSSDRSEKPVKLSEDIRVMHVHDGTGEPVKSSTNTHIVEEFVPAEDRDTASSNANKFNLAINEENIDFNIPGVPNSMVDVEPKAQCRACLTYWDVGIVYCTCGHFLRDDTTENKKYIKSVLDLFSIPNFYIRKGRPHGHRYGKKEGCKEYHTANQLQKKNIKRKYKNIHDRFIRDTWFRKTMLELGRTEEVILEMDQLASEDHSHIAAEEGIDVFCGNWWIRSNFVGSDTMLVGHRLDFKKALSDIASPQESRGQSLPPKLVAKLFLLVVAMANFLVASLI